MRVAVSPRFEFDPRSYAESGIEFFELDPEPYVELVHGKRRSFDVIRIAGPGVVEMMDSFDRSKRLGHDETTWILGSDRLAAKAALAVRATQPGYAAQRLFVPRRPESTSSAGSAARRPMSERSAGCPGRRPTARPAADACRRGRGPVMAHRRHRFDDRQAARQPTPAGDAAVPRTVQPTLGLTDHRARPPSAAQTIGGPPSRVIRLTVRQRRRARSGPAVASVAESELGSGQPKKGHGPRIRVPSAALIVQAPPARRSQEGSWPTPSSITCW